MESETRYYLFGSAHPTEDGNPEWRYSPSGGWTKVEVKTALARAKTERPDLFWKEKVMRKA